MRLVPPTTAALLLIATGARARAGERMEPDDLPDPRPEIAANEPRVALPAVPSFELPAGEPGVHGARELRVRGAPLLGTEIKAKGYVTSIDDCPAALIAANPQSTRAEVLLAIRRDASLCERLWFYLGDTPGASRDASIWVVDVPRRQARAERESESDSIEEFARWLAQPRIAVGDHVVVTGRWATRSSHDRATHGLLVYQSLEHVRPAAAAAAPATTAPVATGSAAANIPTATATGPARPPEVVVANRSPSRPAMRKAVPVPVFNASVDHLNACIRQNDAGHYDLGIFECQTAVTTWDGNHLAWYALASAHLAKREWAKAQAAAERAVKLRPDRAMYQLYYGMARYEAERQRAGDEAAKRGPRRAGAGDAAIDPSRPPLEAARDALWRAARLGPQLWRAHYYLGQVHRDLDDSRQSAEAFTQAIAMHPRYRAGYLALSELYRSWDHVDQALAVARLGAAMLPSDAELWYEVGMAYDARRADDPAIAAFSKALAARPGDVRSSFQRGQVYLRKGDTASARRDLEAVVASNDPQGADVKPIAMALLARLRR